MTLFLELRKSSIFKKKPWHAWKERQVSKRPPITTVLTVALENCKKSTLKHFTGKSILLNFDGIMTHFEKMPYFALNECEYKHENNYPTITYWLPNAWACNNILICILTLTLSDC